MGLKYRHGDDVDNPSSGVHGVTGNVVGTTDTQTLTNKTLTSPVLNGSLSGDAFLDEDDLSSDADDKAPSQQSVKAYIDAAIAALSPDSNVQAKVKSANETVTSSTTVQDDDHLAGYVLEADTQYLFEGRFLMDDGAGDGGFRFVFDFTETPQVNPVMVFTAMDDAASTQVASSVFGNLTTEFAVSVTSTGQLVCWISGHFTTNASAGGTLTFRWAQNISDATASTLYQGSHLKLTKTS